MKSIKYFKYRGAKSMTQIMGFQIVDIKKQIWGGTQELFSITYNTGQALSRPLTLTQDTRKLHRWVITPKLKLKLLFPAAGPRRTILRYAGRPGLLPGGRPDAEHIGVPAPPEVVTQS